MNIKFIFRNNLPSMCRSMRPRGCFIIKQMPQLIKLNQLNAVYHHAIDSWRRDNHILHKKTPGIPNPRQSRQWIKILKIVVENIDVGSTFHAAFDYTIWYSLNYIKLLQEHQSTKLEMCIATWLLYPRSSIIQSNNIIFPRETIVIFLCSASRALNGKRAKTESNYKKFSRRLK